MTFTISKFVYRFAGRDIILVTFEDGALQPMYRSSGHNSGMPGTWLPFDGISHEGFWFNKTRYCVPAVSSEFQRFGNAMLVTLSQELGTVEIPTGQEVEWGTINAFLGFKPR